MNEEFIAMCDCPEIQGGWKPKICDTIYSKVTKKTFVISTTVKYSTYGNIYKDREDLIYIPSIEDLIEMCEEFTYHIENLSQYSYTSIYKYQMNIFKDKLHANNFKEKSYFKAMLFGYMYAKHNKIWKDGKWQKGTK